MLHHIVIDRWSTAVLARELSPLYGALRFGVPSPLPDLPVQYADFAGGSGSGCRVRRRSVSSYWGRAWRGAGARPADRPTGPAAADLRAGGQLSVALGADLTQAVKALARREGATLFMPLLAAFQVLLYR